MAGTAVISTIKHDVSGAAPTFRDGAGNEIGQLCKGWVNFSGSSGITTRGTFNSSSITRSQAGNYHFSFSVSLSDSNYSTLGTASIAGTTFALFTGDEIANRTTSRTGLCWTTNAASVNNAVDSNNVSINVFR